MVVRANPIPHKDCYRLHFSYRRKQYKRFLIQSKSLANLLQNRVNLYIEEFSYGTLALPPNTSLPDFIFDKAIDKEKKDSSIILFSQFLEEYQQTFASSKAETTQKTENIHISHLKKFMKQRKHDDYLLSAFDISFFEAYKKYRKEQNVRNDTINKELNSVQAIFEKAIKLRYLSHNVLRDVERLQSEISSERFRTTKEIEELLKYGDFSSEEIKEIKRFRYLTPKEIKELLLLAKDGWLYPILATFSWTGIRRGELIRLQWSDVDLERGFMWARSRKQSKKKKEVTRCIPIHEDLKTILAELKVEAKSRWIFSNAKGKQISVHSLRDAIKRLTKNTKFEGINGTHIFRHSIASNLADQGVDQRIIDGILGHQTEGMRKRYQHLYPESKKGAVDALDYLS